MSVEYIAMLAIVAVAVSALATAWLLSRRREH